MRLVEGGVRDLADPDGLIEDDAAVVSAPLVVRGRPHSPETSLTEIMDDGDDDFAILVAEVQEVAGFQVFLGELELLGCCRCCVGHADQPLSSVE